MPTVASQTTDWTLYALCQQSTSEALRDPLKSKYENPCSAYETLEENLKALDDLDSLPLSINISRLDDGTGIEATLRSHNAKWHKTCYAMCDKTKVDRIRKRKPNNSPQKQICHHLKVGFGLHFLLHQLKLSYLYASFVMP